MATNPLMYCDSQEVPAAMVGLAPEMSDAEVREMLRSDWSRCEAHGPWRDGLLALFKRAGFVTDLDDDPASAENVPALTDSRYRPWLTVYRGNLGEEEPVGLSWTLSQERAQFFCRYYTSIRAQFVLGIPEPPPGQHPKVWHAYVMAQDVLGYFDGRGEQEVVVDPATLVDAFAIQELRPVGEEEEET